MANRIEALAVKIDSAVSVVSGDAHQAGIKPGPLGAIHEVPHPQNGPILPDSLRAVDHDEKAKGWGQ
jgi:hypothetical protein